MSNTTTTKTLDFSKTKKEKITMKLPNGDVVKVAMPTKRRLEEMLAIIDLAEKGDTFEDTQKLLNMQYELLTTIINSGKPRDEKVTVEWVEELLDIEDMKMFYDAYCSLVFKELDEKN